ncbi:MAG: type II secretion system protein GspG [Planctomycetes bacterium]|nr:type II secretion system protein GspG [Planctomycetota bacterium]
MITTAFLLAAAAQGTTSHPALHPDSAFLYAELPDVKGMIRGYERAPVIQLVKDESVRKAVYGTLESFDIDLDEKLSELGGMLGLPDDQAASPVTAMVAYLGRLQSASVSLTFVADPSGAPLQASATTMGELAQLQALIEQHRSTNGELPASLDVLSLTDALQQDAWNHPYEYSRSADGETFTLASLGADGKSGGEGANADIELGKEAEAGKRMIQGIATQIGALAVLTFDQPANAKWAHELFVAGTQKATLQPAATTPVKYRGATGKLERWSPSADIEFPVWAISTDRDLVIGLGATTPEQALALAEGQGKAIASLPKFASLPTRLPAPAGVPIGHVFMQSEGMMQLAYQGGAQTEALRELIERTGGETFARMNLVGERFVTEMVNTPSSKNYFGKSMGQKPLPPELWKCIPDDAIAFYATSVDGAELYKELMFALSGEHPGLDKRVAELEAKHGINLERDLFANLNGGAVGYVLGIKGFPPGMALIADLTDPQAFTRGMTSLLKLVSEQEGIPFSIKANPYKYKDVECPKWTFSFEGGAESAGFGGAMVPTPTVAVVKNRLVVTLFSARATKEIKRLLGDEGEPHALLASSLRPPQNATVVGYMDWAELLGGTYKTALGFASMIGGAMGGDSGFDPSKLPEVTTFTRFFKPTVMFAHPIEGGSYMRLESSFGPETWCAFLGGIVAGVAVSQASSEFVPPEAPTEPDVPEVPVPPSAEQISTELAADSIQTAIVVFKSDTGRLPKALDELTKPTKAYPKGFFNGGPVPKDGWGRDYRYAPAADGKSYRMWSVGLDGADQEGEGDDIASN